jgi:hypothetical protein
MIYFLYKQYQSKYIYIILARNILSFDFNINIVRFLYICICVCMCVNNSAYLPIRDIEEGWKVGESIVRFYWA